MQKGVFISCMLFVASLAAVHHDAVGQSKKCRTNIVNPASQQAAETWGAQRNPAAVTKLVRVYFHITRGIVAHLGYSMEGAPLWALQEEFNDLVEDFAPYNICFSFVGYDYIDDPSINSNFDPDKPEDEALLQPYLVPNCINIFYHYELDGNLGGSAYSIPNTYLSIARGNIGLWRTISHEMGHCLGLMHTFETNNGEEYINGNNCSTRGDRVCDTPADPYTDESSCFSASNCVYTGSCTDPSGAGNYSPPYQNIMSYWADEGCTVTHFTAGQYARANSFMETDGGLLNTVSPATLALGSVNVSSGYFFRTARTSMALSGTINFTGQATTSLQSQSVTLPPGFTASPEGGGSTLIRATCIY